jgi:hypothetical protein
VTLRIEPSFSSEYLTLINGQAAVPADGFQISHQRQYPARCTLFFIISLSHMLSIEKFDTPYKAKKMKNIFLSFVVLIMATSVNAQKYNIKVLMNVYNSNSLEEALIKINKIHKFNGKYFFDSLSMKSTLKGEFGHDYLIVSSLNEKTELVITIHDSSGFENLLKQANQLFSLDNNFILPTEYRNQEYYRFLNEEKSMEFLLSKHILKSNASNYGLPDTNVYQVKMTSVTN